jgi:hypothetical protein
MPPGLFLRFPFLSSSLHVYWERSQLATALGSNRTQVPTRNDGMRPAAACLKIVTLETEKSFDSSWAVKARPIFSI